MRKLFRVIDRVVDRTLPTVLLLTGALGIFGHHFGFGGVDPIDLVVSWVLASTGLILLEIRRGDAS